MFRKTLSLQAILPIALCTLFFAPASVRAQDTKIAVKAAALIKADGSRVENAVMLVVNGKIAKIGSGIAVPDGFRVIDRSAYTLAPGMIDIASKAGAPLDLKEEADAVDLTSDAASAVARDHRDFALLRAAGVTTVCILPDDENVVSGRGAVLKTGGKSRDGVGASPVQLSLRRTVYSRTRLPTSFTGARQLLSETLAAWRGKEGPVGHPLADLAGGRRNGLFRVDSTAGLRAGLGMARRNGMGFSFLVDNRVREMLAEMKGGRFALVLPAPARDSILRNARLAADCTTNGLTVALNIGTPKRSAEELRSGAAIAVANGMPRRAGVAAITSVPAAMIGAGDVIGDLAPGRHADFIVLKGDILDLSAGIVETWIDGRRVYVAKEKS